jgi:IS5 family transposase
MCFTPFFDLTLADDIPDSRTVWAFREQITNNGLVEKLFDLYQRIKFVGINRQ